MSHENSESIWSIVGSIPAANDFLSPSCIHLKIIESQKSPTVVCAFLEKRIFNMMKTWHKGMGGGA